MIIDKDYRQEDCPFHDRKGIPIPRRPHDGKAACIVGQAFQPHYSVDPDKSGWKADLRQQSTTNAQTHEWLVSDLHLRKSMKKLEKKARAKKNFLGNGLSLA